MLQASTTPLSIASENDLERLEAAQIEIFPVLRNIASESQLGKSAQQSIEGDARFEPCQRGAKAKVVIQAK